MNSLLQQFFMIPGLRESLLAIEDKSPQSTLNFLKNIFSSLKCSDSQFYNCKDLCMHLSLDIREQMDVDEFFNTLIDKVETNIKETRYSNIFKYFFGLTIADELIPSGCSHNSENIGYNNSVILQVLNKKSIYESLKSYVEGEMLEGDNAYKCEKCDKKVNTLKRQCIKKLPRMLILVMKRFEFDYENMVKIKVNDYCEFPFELNMEPYTQEYLVKMNSSNKEHENKKEDEEIAEEMLTDVSQQDKEACKPANFYKYNLSGVIIHTGTSESGHYYSIIKNNSKDTWNEFNDTNVKYYDINDLPNDAFGGTEVILNKDNKKETVEKQSNAYLLFYKRQYEEDDNSCDIVKEWDKFSNISPSFMDRVEMDNMQYWIMKNLFSNEYHSFLTDILVNSNTYENLVKTHLTKNDNFDLNIYNRPIKNTYSNNIDDSLIINPGTNEYVIINDPKYDEGVLFSFACGVFFNIILRSKDKTNLSYIIDIVKAYINKDVEHAHWLLEEFSNIELINEYLIDCPLIEVRKVVVGVIYCAMIKSYKTNSNFETNCILKQFFGNTIHFILKYFGNIEKDSTFLYFVLYRMSLLGENSRNYLVQVGILNYLTCYFANKAGDCDLQKHMKIEFRAPSHLTLNEKRMSKAEKLSSIEELIEKKHAERLIQLRNDYYLLMAFVELVINTNLNIVENSTTLLKYLKFSNQEFVRTLVFEVKSKASLISFGKLMSYTCSNNPENSITLQNVLIDILNNLDSYELEYAHKIFKRFLLIEDTLKDSRVIY